MYKASAKVICRLAGAQTPQRLVMARTLTTGIRPPRAPAKAGNTCRLRAVKWARAASRSGRGRAARRSCRWTAASIQSRWARTKASASRTGVRIGMLTATVPSERTRRFRFFTRRRASS